MENSKEGRTLERATSLLYAGLGTLAAGYTLLGWKDISTYDTDQFRYAFEPAATFGLVAGMAAVGALAYTGASRLMRKLERRTAENADNERKEIRAKGCMFAAPIIGAGLLGAAYNHDAIKIPHLDPALIVDKIPTELTTSDPERRRNLRFLTKHLVMPDLSDNTARALANTPTEDSQDIPYVYHAKNPQDPNFTLSTSVIENRFNNTPVATHSLYDGEGKDTRKTTSSYSRLEPGEREYLTIGTRTIFLDDETMRGHPDYHSLDVATFASADPHFTQGDKCQLLRVVNGTASYISFASRTAPESLNDYINGAAHRIEGVGNDQYFGDLIIRDITSGKELISEKNIIAHRTQDRPEGIAPRIMYAKQDGDAWRVYVIDLTTFENRRATAQDQITWNWEDLGPIEVPR